MGEIDMRWLVPALALLSGGHAVAQTAYPGRPIKMIVPLAAASTVDVAARIVTQKMADNMDQQIVILNQTGASGMIGAEAVARAEPDGYTIAGFNDSIRTMVPNLQSKMRWDILKDFEPVSLVATVEWGLIASNQTSYRNATDLIAAKTSPGKIDYGSGGPGSPQHLAMAMLASTAGISLIHASCGCAGYNRLPQAIARSTKIAVESPSKKNPIPRLACPLVIRIRRL
jgi:tripartite-type tricarboxylate transporter receptor subunit TctC